MKYNNQILEIGKARREENIKDFSALSRDGLEFGKTERMLLLHTTQDKEKIFIQYPGKETKNSKAEKIRPWDFRPKVQLADGTFMKDLTFSEIWDDISEIQKADKNALAVLASILFKMAFMAEHEKVIDEYDYNDIDIQENTVVFNDKINFSWYKPNFDLNELDNIQKVIGKIRGVSLEAYLWFNDLLAQNEDCKYYYRDVELKEEKWNYNVGRRNTLLSHVSVIAYLQGKITFSQIMSRFQAGSGVAPCKINEISEITNGIITN